MWGIKMFDNELILISYSVEPDDIGNQKQKKNKKTILCSIESTTRMEFYNYGDSELRPELVATINLCEYENEVEAEFRGEQYVITRVYEADRDLLELTLSRRIQR